MEEFMKKKGKEGTRGAKQIASENVETIVFYRVSLSGKENSNNIQIEMIQTEHDPWS